MKWYVALRRQDDDTYAPEIASPYLTVIDGYLGVGAGEESNEWQVMAIDAPEDIVDSAAPVSWGEMDAALA